MDDETVAAAFGRAVTAERLAQQVSIAALAERTDLSVVKITRIETGKFVSLEEALAIAHALQVSILDLIDGPWSHTERLLARLVVAMKD